MAITATAAPSVVIVQDGAVVQKRRFAALLSAKDAVQRRGKAAIVALGRLAERAHIDGPLRYLQARFGWLMSKLAWIPRVLGKAGIAGVVAWLTSTETGHAIIKTAVKVVLTPVVWVVKKLYGAITWFMRLFGKPGRALAAKTDQLVYGAIDSTINSTVGIRAKAAALVDPSSTTMKTVATVGRGLVAQALIAAFVPAGWAWLAYTIAAPLVVPALRWGSVKTAFAKAKETGQEIAAEVNAVVEAPAPQAQPVSTPVPVIDGELDSTVSELLDEPILSTNSRKAQAAAQRNAALEANREAAVQVKKDRQAKAHRDRVEARLAREAEVEARSAAKAEQAKVEAAEAAARAAVAAEAAAAAEQRQTSVLA